MHVFLGTGMRLGNIGMRVCIPHLKLAINTTINIHEATGLPMSPVLQPPCSPQFLSFSAPAAVVEMISAQSWPAPDPPGLVYAPSSPLPLSSAALSVDPCRSRYRSIDMHEMRIVDMCM